MAAIGDVIERESYTIFCGDCRDILPGRDADLTLTDPPYVMAHMDGGGFASAIQFYADGALDGMDSFDLEAYADLLAQSADQLVAFHSRDQIADYANFCLGRFGKFDLHFWHKTNAIPFTNNTWKSDIEYIALGWRKKSHQDAPQAMKSKAWISPICTDRHHPACKPVELMAKYVRILTPPGSLVCDPFMGSGTTGVAALRCGRRFIGVELNPVHFETAASRLAAESSQAKMAFLD